MTGAYLTGRAMIRLPEERRNPCRGALKITGAKANNLHNVTAQIEFGTLTVVTGVSGSGKSSLVTDTIAPALTNAVHNSTRVVGPYKSIEGIDQIDKVIDIDQSPIGRTPRSNPATYIGLWDDLRALFASVPGVQGARLLARAILLQRARRSLRGLQGRRSDQDRDALPPGYLRAVRGVRRQSATTARRSRCATATRPSPTCWTCP